VSIPNEGKYAILFTKMIIAVLVSMLCPTIYLRLFYPLCGSGRYQYWFP
jgi:hypothetical protein